MEAMVRRDVMVARKAYRCGAGADVIACLPLRVALVGAVGVMPDAGPMAGHFCELKFRLSLQRASFSSSFK